MKDILLEARWWHPYCIRTVAFQARPRRWRRSKSPSGPARVQRSVRKIDQLKHCFLLNWFIHKLLNGSISRSDILNILAVRWCCLDFVITNRPTSYIIHKNTDSKRQCRHTIETKTKAEPKDYGNTKDVDDTHLVRWHRTRSTRLKPMSSLRYETDKLDGSTRRAKLAPHLHARQPSMLLTDLHRLPLQFSCVHWASPMQYFLYFFSFLFFFYLSVVFDQRQMGKRNVKECQ